MDTSSLLELHMIWVLFYFILGFGRAARAGSCALVCVVHNDKLYCGNAGDSLGIVVEEGQPMGYV